MFEYTEEQIERARNDFRVFVWIVWKAIGLPPPTEIQLDMAYHLQHFPYDRMIIEGFRGVAKSFITCAFCVWCLWNNRQLKIEIVSASKDRSDANAVFIKRIIETIPFLREMLPGAGHRNTMNLFDVGGSVPDISPSIKSVGIYGQITGSRADILIGDDVEVPSNSATQIQRDKLGEAVKEFDAIIKPGGRIIYLGTPQCEMSLYEELQKRGYTAMVWTVEYPHSQKEREDYGIRLAPLLAKRFDEDPEKWAGQPTDPARFNRVEIDKRKLSYGRAGFALQFMLNTNLSDAEKYPLKIQDLIVANLDLKEASLKWAWSPTQQTRIHDIPCVALKGDYFYAPLSQSQETGNYTSTVMAIDPSGRGTDETAYAIVKFLNGYLFLMEIGGFKDGYSDGVLTSLATKAKFYGVNDIVIESNFGDGMYTQLFKPVLHRIHPATIHEVRHSTQKEKRIIDTLEPVLMRHKLIVNQSVIVDDYRIYEQKQYYSFIYQLTRIHKEPQALAHDDRLDVVCMAVAFFNECMAVDDQSGLDEHMDEMLKLWTDPDGYLGWNQMGKTDNNSNFREGVSILSNYNLT